MIDKRYLEETADLSSRTGKSITVECPAKLEDRALDLLMDIALDKSMEFDYTGGERNLFHAYNHDASWKILLKITGEENVPTE